MHQLAAECERLRESREVMRRNFIEALSTDEQDIVRRRAAGIGGGGAAVRDAQALRDEKRQLHAAAMRTRMDATAHLLVHDEADSALTAVLRNELISSCNDVDTLVADGAMLRDDLSRVSAERDNALIELRELKATTTPVATATTAAEAITAATSVGVSDAIDDDNTDKTGVGGEGSDKRMVQEDSDGEANAGSDANANDVDKQLQSMESDTKVDAVELDNEIDDKNDDAGDDNDDVSVNALVRDADAYWRKQERLVRSAEQVHVRFNFV